mmetsp:Transcript_22637/g.62157  ORF Transcript_22637/g.62157 Transcript_22637/m.62157 type:complete len:229 (+) Transcript_22637:201-887(+)
MSCSRRRSATEAQVQRASEAIVNASAERAGRHGEIRNARVSTQVTAGTPKAMSQKRLWKPNFTRCHRHSPSAPISTSPCRSRTSSPSVCSNLSPKMDSSLRPSFPPASDAVTMWDAASPTASQRDAASAAAARNTVEELPLPLASFSTVACINESNSIPVWHRDLSVLITTSSSSTSSTSAICLADSSMPSAIGDAGSVPPTTTPAIPLSISSISLEFTSSSFTSRIR